MASTTSADALTVVLRLVLQRSEQKLGPLMAHLASSVAVKGTSARQSTAHSRSVRPHARLHGLNRPRKPLMGACQTQHLIETACKQAS